MQFLKYLVVFYCLIITPASAEVVIKHDLGGVMSEYILKYIKMAKSGETLRVDGQCDSSCTLFLGYMPLDHVCVTPDAKLGFHRASRPEGTMLMMTKYPTQVVMWILDVGLTEDIKYMDGDLVSTLIKQCPPREQTSPDTK